MVTAGISDLESLSSTLQKEFKKSSEMHTEFEAELAEKFGKMSYDDL